MIFCCTYLHILQAQELKIQEEKYKHFVDKVLNKYGDTTSISITIQEYNVEKIKQFISSKYIQLNSQEKSMYHDFLNSYDERRLSQPSIENSVRKNGEFYSMYEEPVVDAFDSSKIYKSHKPILKYFYTNRQHFLAVNHENFSLRINPIIHLEAGNASNYSNDVFQNTRGLNLKGYIDNKVYFYSEILESQQGFMTHIEDFIARYKAIPQNGLYKNYKSSVLTELQGYDFLNARGFIGMPITKSIGMELGHGRNFIGNGYRSLLLSDFSNNYFYLKFNTSVWKLHYQNIFSELNPFSANFLGEDELLGKKYMANHFLTYKANKNLEIGVFESIIFSRPDKFEYQYLNPVIFYRTVEHLLGSADNALLGGNINYKIDKKALVYGQIMLDEFNLELFRKDGWWANKQGYQIGMKFFDLIKGIDAFVEFNTVRPYTYAHNRPIGSDSTITNYSHYNQPLAHPLGANFREILFGINGQLSSRLHINFVASSMAVGRDKDGKNFGNDFLKSTNTYASEFGNKTLQGERNDILFIRSKASYELFKNYNLFLNLQYRKSTSANQNLNTNNLYLGGGLSVNFNNDRNIF